MLIIFLFYLNQLNISLNFIHFLIHEKEKNGELSLLDVEVSRQQVNSWQQFIGNLPLVVCVPILIDFCQWYTNLIRYTGLLRNTKLCRTKN